MNGSSIGTRVCSGAKLQTRIFFTALQFFTRLPIPRWVGFHEEWLQQAVRFFPSIGWIVAALAGAVYYFANLVWPPAVAVLLSVVSGVLLTGALHEDGFADVCDGFGGGTGKERVLDIMKDSRVGVYGVIGIGLLLALKCVTLGSMPPSLVPVALLIAHPASRLFAVSLIWRLNYVRVDGKAKSLAQRMTNGEFWFAALTAIAPALGLMLAGWISWQKMAAGAILAVFTCIFLIRMFLRRIGGYTGDCLGAVQQATEMCFYLGFLAC